MRARTLLKQAVRKAVNGLGWDIVRRAPEPCLFEFDEFLLLPAMGIRTVIDIGAHEGEFAALAARALPAARIFSFEPLPGTFERLQARMAGHSNFKAYPVALGEAAGTGAIHRNDYTMSSSLLEMEALHKEAFPFTGQEPATLEIRIERLDDALASQTLAEPILVKIDVQGFEDRVIAGGPALLARAEVVICEVSFRPLYAGQRLFNDIDNQLGALGLRYQGSIGQLLDPRNGVPLQADALFLRDREKATR